MPAAGRRGERAEEVGSDDERAVRGRAREIEPDDLTVDLTVAVPFPNAEDPSIAHSNQATVVPPFSGRGWWRQGDRRLPVVELGVDTLAFRFDVGEGGMLVAAMAEQAPGPTAVLVHTRANAGPRSGDGRDITPVAADQYHPAGLLGASLQPVQGYAVGRQGGA
jgi:hypothetical protein